jgi:hypothetical protein
MMHWLGHIVVVIGWTVALALSITLIILMMHGIFDRDVGTLARCASWGMLVCGTITIFTVLTHIEKCS